jgi:hypothetical protein
MYTVSVRFGRDLFQFSSTGESSQRCAYTTHAQIQIPCDIFLQKKVRRIAHELVSHDRSSATHPCARKASSTHETRVGHCHCHLSVLSKSTRPLHPCTIFQKPSNPTSSIDPPSKQKAASCPWSAGWCVLSVSMRSQSTSTMSKCFLLLPG